MRIGVFPSLSFAIRRAAAAFALSAALIAPQALATPSPKPILRIETGGHSAKINDIAISPDGALVATVSDDKTARLWDLKTGALVETLRIPIAAGDEGILQSAAFSPSGKSLLIGGVSGLKWDRKNYLYAAHVVKGEMLGRIPIGGVLNKISFRYDLPKPMFALSLGARQGGGLQVRDARTKNVFTDTNFQGSVVWAEFSQNGALAAVDDSGLLHIYAPGFQSKTDVRLPSDQVAEARFSPDGALLAVSYLNKRTVEIYNASNGARVSELGGAFQDGVPRLNAITWAARRGAQELWVAGGFSNLQGRTVVRRFRDISNPDAYEEIPVARDAITRLEAAPNGEIVFASSDPVWGVIGADGSVRYSVADSGPDFRSVSRALFALSTDGRKLSFRFDRFLEVGDLQLDFKTSKISQLHQDDAAAVKARAKSAQAPGGLRNWELSLTPSFNGTPLKLADGERSLSADTTPGGGVILGADGALYLYDASGRRVAQRTLSSAAWGVLTAPSGGYAIAALGDGAFRWYSLDPKTPLKEIGGVYVDRTQFRWVAWLADGRFTHSDNGGQRLVGYHQNRSSKEFAEWTDFSQLYRKYYAPEEVMAVLSGAKPYAEQEDNAASLLRENEPPQVSILEICFDQPSGESCIPAEMARPGVAGLSEGASSAGGYIAPEDTQSVTLKYRIDNIAGQLETIDAYVNGASSARASRGLGGIEVEEQESALFGRRKVRLRPGPNEIRLRAYDERDVYGESKTIKLVKASEIEPEKTLHVLAVGVNAYPGQSYVPLRWARKDAEDMVALLSNPDLRPSDFTNVLVTPLYDEQASLANIKQALEAMAQVAQPQDSVVLYLAGHGVVNEDDGSYHFIPADIAENGGSATFSSFAQLKGRSLDEASLSALLSQIQVSNIFMILDTCYAGGYDVSSAGKLNNDTGFAVLTASSDEQAALDQASINGAPADNGTLMLVFQHAIEQALTPGLLNRGKVRKAMADSVGLAVRDILPQLAQDLNHDQTAQFKVARAESEERTSFPLAQSQ